MVDSMEKSHEIPSFLYCDEVQIDELIELQQKSRDYSKNFNAKEEEKSGKFPRLTLMSFFVKVF